MTDNPAIPQYLHIWIKQIDRGLIDGNDDIYNGFNQP